MAGYHNDVFLMGEIRDHPEFVTNDHGEFCKLLLEVKQEWKDALTGQMESREECFPIFIASPHTVNYVKTCIKKGNFIYIQGAVQSRKYHTQTGEERYALQILIGKTKGKLTYVGKAAKKSSEDESSEASAAPKSCDLTNDEIPF